MIRHCSSEPVFPSRVVVLGASGFVGQALADHLLRLGIETLRLSSAEVDLCSEVSPEILKRVVRDDDAIVITATITPDRGRDIRTLMQNLKMGEHLSAFLESSGCSHAVYVSSDAVYSDDTNPVRETSCCNPGTLHGLMHLARERMLAHALREKKVPLLLLRPCALYGPKDTHNSYGPNRFLRSAQKDRRIALFGNGEEKRDHVYIQDLSCLIGLCLVHRSEGVLNIATGNSVSFADLVHAVVQLCSCDVQIERLPRSAPVTHRHFDATALVKAFPSFRFTPLEYGLSESLRKMDKEVRLSTSSRGSDVSCQRE